MYTQGSLPVLSWGAPCLSVASSQWCPYSKPAGNDHIHTAFPNEAKSHTALKGRSATKFWTGGPQSHLQRASTALCTLIIKLYLKDSRQLIRFHKLGTSYVLWPQRSWTTVWESVALGLWTRANQAWKKMKLETYQRKSVIWGILVLYSLINLDSELA